MARQKETQVEILSPESRLPVPVVREGDIKELIKAAVVEIAANSDNWLFEPYFRPRVIADEIRRLQTAPERKVSAERYERYGCVHCHKNTQPHAGLGFCDPCYKKERRIRQEILRDLEKDRDAR